MPLPSVRPFVVPFVVVLSEDLLLHRRDFLDEERIGLHRERGVAAEPLPFLEQALRQQGDLVLRGNGEWSRRFEPKDVVRAPLPDAFDARLEARRRECNDLAFVITAERAVEEDVEITPPLAVHHDVEDAYTVRIGNGGAKGRHRQSPLHHETRRQGRHRGEKRHDDVRPRFRRRCRRGNRRVGHERASELLCIDATLHGGMSRDNDEAARTEWKLRWRKRSAQAGLPTFRDCRRPSDSP